MIDGIAGVNAINPHGVTISFGKHKGELFTRLPRSYIRWMINEKTPQYEVAQAEFERRGDTMPKVELSGHAIDNASIRIWKTFQARKDKQEGLYSWLQRMTLEAIKHGEPMGDGIHWYKGMKFCIAEGEEFPTLKTIMRIKS
jgi:hypothetical protein